MASTANIRIILIFAAFLSTICASSSDHTGNDTHGCFFAENSPRYYTIDAIIHVMGVSEDISLSDALLRALATQLKISECQSSLSVGQTCSASLAEAPCADPFYLCAGTIAVSHSLFQAALSGVCRLNTTQAKASSICQSLANYPEVARYAIADKCQAICMATLSSSSASDIVLEAPAPAPIEREYCFSHTLQLRAPSEADAANLADSLRTEETLQLLIEVASNFAPAKSSAQVIFAEIGITEVVGFGDFPPPPPPPPSPPPPLFPVAPQVIPASPPSPLEAVPNTNSLQLGDWGMCSTTCGKGWQSRSIACMSSDGAILPLQDCPGAINAAIWQPCMNQACSAYWQYSAWSACNATCGGGFAFRSASCIATNGGDCGSQPLTTAIKCNNMPCNVYTWHVGSWGECSVECGGGVSTRSARCLDSFGNEVNGALCIGRKPATVQKCNLRACNFCQDNNCLGNGNCNDDQCNCHEGYIGEYCQVPSSCGSGIVDEDLACCPSGVLDNEGNCCESGAVIDGFGSCCTSGKLDACGVCGGNAVTKDIQGSCCSTLLDAQGVCCESGVVDECGVCDGLSNTCKIDLKLGLEVNGSYVYEDAVAESAIDAFFDQIAVVLQLPSSSINVVKLQQIATETKRRRLQASPPLIEESKYVTAEVTILPNGTGPTVNVPFSRAWIQSALSAYQNETNTGGISLFSVGPVLRKGLCGNGICEVGERSGGDIMGDVCLADCPVRTQACTAGCGHGTCLVSMGSCQCFPGYTGEDCSQCAAGYLKSGKICVIDVVAQQLVKTSPKASPFPPIQQPPAPDTPDIGVTDSQSSTDNSSSNNEGDVSELDTISSNNTGVIIGAVIGSCVATLLAISLYILCRRHRKRCSHDRKGENDDSYGGLSDLESNIVIAEEEVGLRQKWSRTNSMASGSLGSAPVLADISNQMNCKTSSTESKKYMNDQIFGKAGIFTAGGLSSGPFNSAIVDQGDSALRDSLDLLRRSADSLRQSIGPLSQGITSTYDHNLRQSISASTTSLPPRPPKKPSSLPASLQVSPQKFTDQIPASRLHASTQHLGTGQLAGHSQDHSEGLPITQPAMSIGTKEGISAINLDTSVDNSMDHFGKVIMRSYTISPLDPKAKLFYNPAYSNDESLQKPASAVPPAYKPLSARELGAKDTAPIGLLKVRGAQEGKGGSVRSSLDTQERREKLDRLRAAVSALEADAFAGRLGHKGPAQHVSLESPSQTHQGHSSLHPSVETFSDITSAGEDSSSPVTIGDMGAPRFLQGRPSVPKLPLHILSQEDADHNDSTYSNTTANVPKLQLHKLENANRVLSDAVPSLSVDDEYIKAHPGQDPIDSLESVLSTVRPQLSSRLTDSFKKMVPLMSARRREIDWAAQLSARGIGTPREDSGMMRTQEGLLSREGSEATSPDKREETAPATSTRARPVQPQLPLATPRTQLLRTLAAEAAVAQKERSLRSMTAPSYDDVMAAVDGALSATNSVAPSSKIPKPPAVSGTAVRPAGRMSSPSRNVSMMTLKSFQLKGSPSKVRLTKLTSADENVPSSGSGKHNVVGLNGNQMTAGNHH